LCPIDYPPLELLLEIADLDARQLGIDEDDVGAALDDVEGQFFDLAGAEVRRFVGAIESLTHRTDDADLRGFAKTFELGFDVLVVVLVGIDVNEKGFLLGRSGLFEFGWMGNG
jgi:hypothetical protein